MREVLGDIIHQTSDMFEVLKVIGSNKETKITAVDDEKVMFLDATLKEPIEEFDGEFGLTNIKLLKGLLDFPSYRTDEAKFNVKRKERNGKETVEQFEFKDANNKGSIFRLMSSDLIPSQAVIKNIPWDITIEPNKSKFSEFQKLANLYSKVENSFAPKTEGNDLVFIIGEEDSSTHQASMVFQSGVDGELKGDIRFGIPQFLSIMRMNSENTKLMFTSRGILCVEIETKYGFYKYFLRAKR